MEVMQYDVEDSVAILRFDDGKANAVSHAFMDAMSEGLDRAEQEANAVMIVGRPGKFSAGFDLKEIQKGPGAAQALLNRGAEMFYRLFGFPQPIVAVSTGHAIAAGAFLLLASDTRVGTAGDFKIGLNETAIGMSLPVFAHELANSRVSLRHHTAAVIQATLYNPEGAVDAGFLDIVAQPDEAEAKGLAIAKQLGALPGHAYKANKRDSRKASLTRILASLK
jgi:enoyl-CoA hydratase